MYPASVFVIPKGIQAEVLRLRSVALRTAAWLQAGRLTGVFEALGLPRLQDPGILGVLALVGFATRRGVSSAVALSHPSAGAEAAVAAVHAASWAHPVLGPAVRGRLLSEPWRGVCQAVKELLYSNAAREAWDYLHFRSAQLLSRIHISEPTRPY